ncbi:MAG: hypothetical protein ACFB6R_11495 [Alphaproteobacteria bacterium]
MADPLGNPAGPASLMLLIRILSRLSFFALGAVIVYLSLKPSMALGTSDKMLHLLGYGVWTFASLIGIRRRPWALGVAAGILLLSGLIELIQPHMGRVGDWGDFIANGLGVLLGGGLARAARSLASWVFCTRTI